MASASASSDSSIDGYTLTKSDITFDMAQQLPTYWPALIESIKSFPIIVINEEEMVGVEKKDKMTVEKRKELDEKREELVNKEIIRQLTFEEIGENSDNEAMRASVVLVYGLIDKNF